MKDLPIPFNLSVDTVQVKKGDTDVSIKNCSIDLPIGTFYMCYSKNLSDLEKLQVDDQRCCYCSEEGSKECKKKFPNWKLTITDTSLSATKCYLSLLTVSERDLGHYQCRLNIQGRYPGYDGCKLRYGHITNVSVSNPPSNHNSHSNISHWLHNNVAIGVVIIIAVILGVIVVTMTTVYCIKKRRVTSSISSGKMLYIHNYIINVDQTAYIIASYIAS